MEGDRERAATTGDDGNTSGSSVDVAALVVLELAARKQRDSALDDTGPGAAGTHSRSGFLCYTVLSQLRNSWPSIVGRNSMSDAVMLFTSSGQLVDEKTVQFTV